MTEMGGGQRQHFVVIHLGLPLSMELSLLLKRLCKGALNAGVMW